METLLKNKNFDVPAAADRARPDAGSPPPHGELRRNAQ